MQYIARMVTISFLYYCEIVLLNDFDKLDLFFKILA